MTQVGVLAIQGDVDAHARALERHEGGEAKVIPIIIRPVDWTKAPCAKLQALPPDAKAVTEWENEDSAFANVATGIRSAIENP